jgi:heme oxygenase (biliverdin-IX-beta and delta-forming)
MAQLDDHAPPGPEARRLIRAADRATLATALARPDEARGWPYASLVLAACRPDGSPLLLLSDLADHSKNIAADPRVSLLFDGTAGLAEPLAGPRLTLLGRAEETHDGADRARYLARHPSAEAYAGFKDFRLYRVAVARGHLVAGFGRIHWLEAGDILYDATAAAALAAREADIRAHMNRDHAAAIALYAERLLGLDGAGWVMTGIDPEGIDLRAGGRIARLVFARPIADAEAARAELVRLAHEAREASAA